MTDTATNSTDIDVRRYWYILLSRRGLIVTSAILGMLLASAILFFTPRTYSASTTLSVFPITTDPYAANRNSNNLIDMRAEALTASSFKVASSAAETADSRWTAAKLRNSTSVSSGTDSTILTITVSAPTEELARDGATVMGETYLRLRSDQAASGIETVVERDRQRILDHRDHLTGAIERLDKALPGSTAAAEASADQQILNAQISALLDRMSALEGIDTTGGVILDPGDMTPIVVKPSMLNGLLTGLAGGLVVGVIAAFVSSSRRRTVRVSRDLRLGVGADALGPVVQQNDSTGMIPRIAQRLLRLIELHDARVIAVVFEDRVPWPTGLADRIADSMRRAGVSSSVRAPGLPVRAASDDIVLIPVPPGASPDERLQAMRISDVTVLVVVEGVTKTRNLSRFAGDAADMGSSIAGAVVVSKSFVTALESPLAETRAEPRPEPRPEPRAESRAEVREADDLTSRLTRPSETVASSTVDQAAG